MIKSEHLLFSIKVFFYVYHITYNRAIQYPCIMLCHSNIGMSHNLRYIFHLYIISEKNNCSRSMTGNMSGQPFGYAAYISNFF